MKKIFSVIALLIFLGINFSAFASEFDINQQYNFNFYGDAVPSPPAYSFSKLIYGKDLGTSNLKSPEDFYITDKGLIYILDSGSNRVIICDLSFKIIKILDEFTTDKGKTHLKGAMGIYVDEKTDNIYIADTNNSRVLVSKQDGTIINTLTLDKGSNIIGPNESFLPQKVSLDISNSICVISTGINQGIMHFSQNGKFLGFLGAPKVKVNLVDLFWRNFMTVDQKEKTPLMTPIIYSNMDLDKSGIIYSTIKTTDFQATQKFRKISPGGYDITRSMGVFPPNGDPFPIIINANSDPIQFKSTLFSDAVTYNNGIYSLLDQMMGRIFTYDSDGNLLYVFGNKGNTSGTFNYPIAIEQNGDNLYILDKNLGSISVFTITQYGKDLNMANQYFQKGDYDKSIKLFQNIVNNNINSEVGYIGLGKNLLIKGDFSEAIKAFKLGNYRHGYNEAFDQFRRKIIMDNFILIFIIGALILAGILALILYQTRENIKIKPIKRNYWSSLKYSLHIMFRPFDGFYDMKNEQRGSIWAATTLLIAFVITYIVNKQYSGFLFNEIDLRFFNLPREIFIILFAIVVWIIANVSVSTWVYGEGKLKYIYMFTCYSLVPIIIFMNLSTLVSNILLTEESIFYYMFYWLGIIWLMFLLFVGNIQVHQYTAKNSLFTIFLSIIQIAIMLFLILVSISLIQQIISFAQVISTEISIR
jgi:tetratricopeptide (TPR) repeat protein